MSDQNRRVERDELVRLRVCYNCRTVFLPAQPEDEPECPRCDKEAKE